MSFKREFKDDLGKNIEKLSKTSSNEILYEINEKAVQFFTNELNKASNKNKKKYITDRGLTQNTIENFNIGYSGRNQHSLIKYLRDLGYEDSYIIKAGLGKISESGTLVGYFWDRIMFPIRDTKNRVVGFGGRILGDGSPKYLNSPETCIFSKKEHLYALNIAQHETCMKYILCEGYMDVVSMHQAGIKNAVASLGTSFTKYQAAIVHRYVDNAILAYDSDEPGKKAAERNIATLTSECVGSNVADLSPCKDPDEFIKTFGKEELLQRLRNAKSSSDFVIERNREKIKNNSASYIKGYEL